MRGELPLQRDIFGLVNLEDRVGKNHPLRAIKAQADEVLKKLSGLFDKMYAQEGRPSIPPERLLKAKIYMALYSVRSDRALCEVLRTDMRLMWFLEMDFCEEGWDHSTFSANQERLMEHEVAKEFFREVYALAKRGGWVSDDHFSVDGTLIEAWASLKSFVKRDGSDAEKIRRAKDDDKGNPTIDFHGEKRSNETHQSTTDPQSVLYKKSSGDKAKLVIGAHALMENRNGFCADIEVHDPIKNPEPKMAVKQLKEHSRREKHKIKSAGGDKNYHTREVVEHCRKHGIKPHVSIHSGRKNIRGLDARTTKTLGYQTSIKIRKRIEEIFGWMKTVGGFRKTRYRGLARTQVCAHLVGSAYNLLRLAKLQALPTCAPG